MYIMVNKKYVRTSLPECFGGVGTNTIFLGQIVVVTEVKYGAVSFKKPVRGSKEIRDGMASEDEFLEGFKPIIQMEENE